ncbi:unnamed protein product, partial [Owenia fusiformis]
EKQSSPRTTPIGVSLIGNDKLDRMKKLKKLFHSLISAKKSGRRRKPSQNEPVHDKLVIYQTNQLASADGTYTNEKGKGDTSMSKTLDINSQTPCHQDTKVKHERNIFSINLSTTDDEKSNSNSAEKHSERNIFASLLLKANDTSKIFKEPEKDTIKDTSQGIDISEIQLMDEENDNLKDTPKGNNLCEKLNDAEIDTLKDGSEENDNASSISQATFNRLKNNIEKLRNISQEKHPKRSQGKSKNNPLEKSS